MASSATASRKVCLFSLAECTLPNLKDYPKLLFMDVYVFDLDQKRYLDLDRNPRLSRDDLIISVAPTLRIECRYPLAHCVIDSRLYLFSGHNEGVFPGDFAETPSKSVYCHDLSSSSPLAGCGEPVVGSLDSMELCSPMCGDKIYPYAMPTPDCQKIVVFSTYICQEYDREYDREGLVDFELYDYVNGTSVELPRLPYLPNHSYFLLYAYYFRDDSTFVVRPSCPGTIIEFSIDLNRDRSSYQWDMITYRQSQEIPPVVRGEGFRVGDSFILSSAGLYDMRRCWTSAEFPHEPDVKVDLDYGKNYFLSAPVDNQNPEICILYVDFDRRGMVHPRVCIDVHRIDHATIFQKDPVIFSDICPGYSGPTPSRSWRYEFKLSIPYARFTPNVLYAVRATGK